MENETATGKNGLLISASALLIVPLVFRISEIIVWHKESLTTVEEKTDYYLHYFPSFLQNITTIYLIAFLFCLAALILGALSIDRVKNNIRWLAFAIVLFSFLIGISCLRQFM
jgi:hypothetical protein